MKFNTSMFIYFFFSAIIAIKANQNINNAGEYGSNEIDDFDYIDIDEEQQTHDVQEKDNNLLQEPQAVDFQYQRSKRLEDKENSMPDSSKAFVPEGKVEETLTDTFASTMATDVANAGLTNANHQWELMLQGSQASQVIDAFGKDFKTIVSSKDAANMINMLATTVRVLLVKAGETNMSSGLNKIMSMTYSLFSSPEMPKIFDKTGQLVIAAVNKPNASLFTKTFWSELQKLLLVKNINDKLKKSFSNLSSMMKPFNKIKKGDNQMKRSYSSA